MKKSQLKELLRHIVTEIKRCNISEDSAKVTDDPQLKQGTDIPMGFVNVEENEEDEKDFPLCATCSGSGEGRADGTKCMTCGGSGVIKPGDEDDLDYREDTDEQSATGGVAGYTTPFAFLKKGVKEVLTPAVIDRARIFAGASLRWAKDPQAASRALNRLAFKVVNPSLRKDYELASKYVLDPKMVKTLQEMTSTGAVAGYSTPFAFSKKGGGAKRALDVTKKMGMKVVGPAPRV